ncbi:MAG: alpha-amylase family glycosyl hydrolase, partial [Enterobacterales bacterium]|nr:alpha-amylase family glycosyl hydrolase [Enterobacterales bacterium]
DGWFVPEMPDLNQRNPYLATYLIQNNIWWIESADLSGMRIDTYSYSDKTFLAKFSQRILQEYPHFNMVGEEWSVDPSVVAYWQKGKQNYDGYQSNLPSLMDFPTQKSLVEALTEKQDWNKGIKKLYAVIATDHVFIQILMV